MILSHSISILSNYNLSKDEKEKSAVVFDKCARGLQDYPNQEPKSPNEEVKLTCPLPPHHLWTNDND